ncbi:MAG: 2TM domain-containing protein [Pseudomonadota bacterium]
MEKKKTENKHEKIKSIKRETAKMAVRSNEYDLTSSVQDEQFARAKLRELKKFYTDLLIYGVVCACSIIVWLSMGAGIFWPIWVIIGCGIDVGLKAISLGQVPWLEEFFPFLGSTWEESQLEKVLNRDTQIHNETQYPDYDLNQQSD